MVRSSNDVQPGIKCHETQLHILSARYREIEKRRTERIEIAVPFFCGGLVRFCVDFDVCFGGCFANKGDIRGGRDFVVKLSVC
jgi:hypothetical protein